MKKTILIFIAAASFVFMTACANTAAQETAVQSEVSRGIAQTAETRQTTPETVERSSADIGEAAAKETALKHAGLTEAEVTFLRSKLDHDDGRTLYDIEFYAGGSEYDYEIDAQTGEIRSYDYDIGSSDAPSAQNSSGSYISMEEAKVIALQKAELSAEQVTYTETAFEYDDGIAVYKIAFLSGSMEHELDIHAETGAILEYDTDRD